MYTEEQLARFYRNITHENVRPRRDHHWAHLIPGAPFHQWNMHPAQQRAMQSQEDFVMYGGAGTGSSKDFALLNAVHEAASAYPYTYQQKVHFVGTHCAAATLLQTLEQFGRAINPLQYTPDRDKVTCGHCRRHLKKELK